MKKYIVITGINGGMGYATYSLLKNKYKDEYVIIGIDIKIDSSKFDKDTYLFASDITNVDNINFIKDSIKEITPKLYAIINLAGIFKMESIIEGSKEDLREIIEVNFFGMYNLNRALFDLLESGSKIINMSSELASYSPQPFMAYYAMTKKMVSCYSDVLRRECNYLGIKVITIESGSMKTKLLDKANSEYDEMVKNTSRFSKQFEKLKYMMDNELKKTNSPDIIAKKIETILEKKNPKIRYRIKRSFALRFMNLLPEKVQDKLYKAVIK